MPVEEDMYENLLENYEEIFLDHDDWHVRGITEFSRARIVATRSGPLFTYNRDIWSGPYGRHAQDDLFAVAAWIKKNYPEMYDDIEWPDQRP